MVRELFEMARTKKACLIFFDEIDAVGGARYSFPQISENNANMKYWLRWLFQWFCYK